MSRQTSRREGLRSTYTFTHQSSINCLYGNFEEDGGSIDHGLLSLPRLPRARTPSIILPAVWSYEDAGALESDLRGTVGDRGPRAAVAPGHRKQGRNRGALCFLLGSEVLVFGPKAIGVQSNPGRGSKYWCSRAPRNKNYVIGPE